MMTIKEQKEEYEDAFRYWNKKKDSLTEELKVCPGTEVKELQNELQYVKNLIDEYRQKIESLDDQG